MWKEVSMPGFRKWGKNTPRERKFCETELEQLGKHSRRLGSSGQRVLLFSFGDGRLTMWKQSGWESSPSSTSPHPRNEDRQPGFDSEDDRLKVKAKLDSVIKKGYIEMCDIAELEAMMYMFSVPKGDCDIRMVYDGSRSGLNEAIWSPWFALPTIDALLRWTVVGSWLGDNDYGEQFLNFPLHPSLQPYCGVDLTQVLKNVGAPGAMRVGRWVCNAMS